MPRASAKYQKIAAVLAERIQRGECVVTGLQSDRAIADEFLVARPTARQALRLLLSQGHITQKANGRFCLPGTAGTPGSTVRIAFLAPSFPSPFIQRMRLATERTCAALGFSYRPIDYLHWNERVVHHTLDGFDGVMLVPPGGMTAAEVDARISKARAGILCLGRDLSSWGKPCLITNPPEGTQTLCDHLAGLGHRRIDCFNAHAPSTGVSLRMQQWQIWRTAHDLDGTLHDRQLAPYADPRLGGYEYMRELLKSGALAATAMICTSELTALGACRALHESGLHVGTDMSVCTFGGDGNCRFFTPTITSLEPVDPTALLRVWLEWIGHQRTGWVGPLLLAQPDRLFHGESTAPPGGWGGSDRRSPIPPGGIWPSRPDPVS